MNISRVIIFTNDVERLAGFYHRCFGFGVIGDSDPGWTELDAGGCSLAFHKIKEDSQKRDGWIKIVFGTADVLTERLRLEKLGASMSEVVRFGDVELCDGRDPDGNIFQISSRGM